VAVVPVDGVVDVDVVVVEGVVDVVVVEGVVDVEVDGVVAVVEVEVVLVVAGTVCALAALAASANMLTAHSAERKERDMLQ
jgi:hypothetical protein